MSETKNIQQPKISPRAFDNNYKNIKAKESRVKKREAGNDIIHQAETNR